MRCVCFCYRKISKITGALFQTIEWIKFLAVVIHNIRFPFFLSSYEVIHFKSSCRISFIFLILFSYKFISMNFFHIKFQFIIKLECICVHQYQILQFQPFFKKKKNYQVYSTSRSYIALFSLEFLRCRIWLERVFSCSTIRLLWLLSRYSRIASDY